MSRSAESTASKIFATYPSPLQTARFLHEAHNVTCTKGLNRWLLCQFQSLMQDNIKAKEIYEVASLVFFP